jgi:hypothetical protein
MAIQKWHVGKLVLLWAWGIFACAILIRVIAGTTDALPGFFLVGAVLAILIVLSVITWKWFGDREQ